MDAAGTTQIERPRLSPSADPPPADRRRPWVAAITRFVAAVVLCTLIAAAGLVMNQYNLSMVDTLDKHLGDWRIALGSPRAPAQRPDIAVVLITEETLLDYESRSPIDRGLLAELIRAIDASAPRAMALDLIFDRRTRSDDRLLAALKGTKAPIVLGAIDRRIQGPQQSLALQAEFLAAAGRPVGHLMLERKTGMLAGASDSTVRLVAGPAAGEESPRSDPAPSAVPRSPPEAFADMIARSAGANHRPAYRDISWLRRPASGEPLFMVLRLPQHDPETLKPALAGLFLDSWRELLKGRIVLVGAHMVDRDQHTTPLSILEGTVPGVLIHAQALAQRLDGTRDIVRWPWWIVFPIVTIVALACFAAARWTGLNPHGALFGLAGLALIGLASFLAYWLGRVDFPSIALTVAWLGGGAGGFGSEWLFRRLGVEKCV
jgi:adenylate cyclase